MKGCGEGGLWGAVAHRSHLKGELLLTPSLLLPRGIWPDLPAFQKKLEIDHKYNTPVFKNCLNYVHTRICTNKNKINKPNKTSAERFWLLDCYPCRLFLLSRAVSLLGNGLRRDPNIRIQSMPRVLCMKTLPSYTHSAFLKLEQLSTPKAKYL